MKNFETVVIEMYPEIQYDNDKLTVVQAQRAAVTYASQIVEDYKKQNSEYIEALREQKELLTKILIHLEIRELEKGLQFDIKQALK